jgi:ribosomal protein L11 methylase PrmA
VPTEKTVWDTYDKVNSYQAEEAAKKRRFVMRMVESCKPKLLYDLGCNTGDYSAAALEAGAEYVVGFDFDHGALEQAVKRSSDGNLPYLPLWLDATNPSPSQGWNEHERRGFANRARGDAVIALAFIHHLAIARNIPLDSVIEWIMNVAPVGIIEFPPKSDPMVQRLLSRREDIFPNYTEEQFIAEVGKRGRIVESEQLSPGGRVMVWYDRS